MTRTERMMPETVSEAVAAGRLERGEVLLLVQAAYEPVDDAGRPTPGAMTATAKVVRSASGEIVATTRITATNGDLGGAGPDRQAALNCAAQRLADSIIARIRQLLGGTPAPTRRDAAQKSAAAW